MDELVCELYREKEGEDASSLSHMALVAVGGYGRRELTPWSDVDLMFLCEETGSQEILERIYFILHTFWDLNFEIGHSVRTIDDCIEVSRRDLRTWTALMDSRFIVGERALFDAFSEKMTRELFNNHHEEFIQRLIHGVWERRSRYSRAPFLVEPHLKEGPGGLRDYQCAIWLARARFSMHNLEDMVDHALISPEEAEEIHQAHRFLWKVRMAAHRIKGRKEDQLTFDVQERLSLMGPFGLGSSGTTVESFMKDYYRCTTTVSFFLEEIIQKATDPSLAVQFRGSTLIPEELGKEFMVVGGRLTLIDDTALERDPPKIIEAISYAHRKGLELDLFTRDHIKASLHLVDEQLHRSRRARDAFLIMLDTQDCGYRALELMYRLGLLQAYLPEFRRIAFRVQHDAYHSYTVDIHSLETINELGKLRGSEPPVTGHTVKEAASEVRDWICLSLAALLHDVGKGEGMGHHERGARIADGLLRRWAVRKEFRQRVIWLIRNHLLLMDTALGRDLMEEKVIVDICREVKDVAHLSELYLLTLADLSATGPGVLTEWKGQLLRELYVKAKHLIQRGELVSDEAGQRAKRARERIVDAFRAKLNMRDLESWIQSLPERYLLATQPQEIVNHVGMAMEMEERGVPLLVSQKQKEGHEEILVCTRDAPGLFSKLCGVLVAHGLNILGARIHTWTNGIVMDTFQVEPLGGGEIQSQKEWLSRLERDFTAVLTGKTDIRELLSKRAPSLLLDTQRHPSIPPRILIDNHASDFYTIVEVRARDQFGLLYAITSTVSRLRLNIHLALVDTRKGQVFDVFYILDETGQKVWEEARLAELERELYRTLERIQERGLPETMQ
jgi:[protein-PII] uridylyltransferase